jgi:hypothetical protein
MRVPGFHAALLLVGAVCTYSAAQNAITAPRFNRAGMIDANVTGVTVDNEGNFYYVGSYDPGLQHDPAGSVDFDPGSGVAALSPNDDGQMLFVAKVNSTFDLEWLRIVRPGASTAWSVDIAVDNSGNVVVQGQLFWAPGSHILNFGQPDHPYDVTFTQQSAVVIWSLNRDGETHWVRVFDNPGLFEQAAMGRDGSVFAMVRLYGTADFDPGPNVFNLTAVKPPGSTGGYSDENIVIVKLSVTGDFVWAKMFAEGLGTLDHCHFEVDDTGNVFAAIEFMGQIDADPGNGVVRYFTGQPLGYSHTLVVRLDASGNYQWSHQSPYNNVTTFTLDKSGGILIAYFNQTPSRIERYSKDGPLIWSRAFGQSSYHSPIDIAAGTNHDFYILGSYASWIDLKTSPGDRSYQQPGGYYIARWDLGFSQIWSTQIGYVSLNNPFLTGSLTRLFYSGNQLLFTGPLDVQFDADPSPEQVVPVTPHDAFDQMFVSLRSHNEVWLDFDLTTLRQMDGTLNFPQRTLANAFRAIQPGQKISIVSPGNGVTTAETGSYATPSTLSVTGAPARIGVAR